MAYERFVPGAASHDDTVTIQLSNELAEQARQLNHATTHPDGITRLATAYTVLGDLATAAHGLDQTLDPSRRPAVPSGARTVSGGDVHSHGQMTDK
jgi:hypothetical protein